MKPGKSNKLVIIGAGISGLSAGVYACQSGFDVTILEKGHNPGGLSTSWKRKGYTIEGGIHWLTGSSDKLPHNRIWKEVGALCDNNPVIVKDPLYTLMDKGRRIPLYRDPAKMARTLIEVAPEDEKAIRRLERHIRALEHFHAPLRNIRGVKAQSRPKTNIAALLRDILPAIFVLPAIMTKSIGTYLRQFKNESVRTLLGSFINSEQNAITLLFTLATYAVGDGGYPKGGSLVMSKNMERKFLSLGGTLLYGSEASRVEVENGRVCAVRYNGDKLIEADAVIVSADARTAIDSLFAQPLQDKWARKLRRDMEVDQCLIFSMGVKADLSAYPHNLAFKLEQPFEYAGCSCNLLLLNIYSGEDHAPEGCAAVTSLLFGDMYDYWKAAREDGTYKQNKQELSARIVALIESCLPELEGKVEFTDLATPVTVQRYCSTYKGGFMSLWKAGKKPANAPIKHKSISGLYFAGQRTKLSGGLPVAVSSGREAVQYLCRDTDAIFVEQA